MGFGFDMSFGGAQSAPGAVSVAPSITGQPTGGEYTGAAAVTLSIAATGSPAPTYQWQSREAGTADAFLDIGGATNSTYDASPVLATDYRCVVTNTAGSATSNTAQVLADPEVIGAGASFDVYLSAKAATVGSPDDGNGVASWTNPGTGDLSFKQATGAIQPVWNDSLAGLSNRPVVEFANTKTMTGRNKADSAAAGWGVLATAAAMTLIVVSLPDSSGTDRDFAFANDIMLGSTAGPNTSCISLRGSGATKRAYCQLNDGGDRVVELTITYGVGQLHMWRHAAGTLFGSLNGGAEDSEACGNASLSSGLMLSQTGLKGKVGCILAKKDGAIANIASIIRSLKLWYGIA